jgi:hypothetical protein
LLGGRLRVFAAIYIQTILETIPIYYSIVRVIFVVWCFSC